MTTETSTIRIVKAEGKLPVHAKYVGQLQPQPAYIELNCAEHTLAADYSGEIGGGVPASVWHRHTLRFPVSPYLTADALNELMEDVQPLAEAVVMGYESVWDGNNDVASYTDEAVDAIRRIEAAAADIADETNTTPVWNVAEWLQDSSLEDMWPAGKTLAEAVELVRENAEFENVALEGDDDDIENYLTDEVVLFSRKNGIEALSQEQKDYLQEHDLLETA